MERDFYKDVLLGVSTGDALGVPVEFKSREYLDKNPVTDMIGYGSYHLPAGTWSDDSSLTFCLAEALTEGYNLEKVALNFSKWLDQAYWTPRGNVFDVGITTQSAIRTFDSVVPRYELAGGMDEYSNGNGSLMRILPLIFEISTKDINERYHYIKEVSSLTHGHIRSVICCFYYLEFAACIIKGEDKFSIYEKMKTHIPDFLNSLKINPDEIDMLHRLLEKNIYQLESDFIRGSGYVVSSLEASIWCLLNTSTYKGAVLKAVNLGEDSDTTGAITGGLAGLLYGYETIPESWLQQLARLDDINQLAERLRIKYAPLK